MTASRRKGLDFGTVLAIPIIMELTFTFILSGRLCFKHVKTFFGYFTNLKLIFFWCTLISFLSSKSYAVVNGQLINSEQLLNSIVRIETETGPCTGIVVGRKTILTAAHCIDAKGAGHAEIPKPVLINMFKTATELSEKYYLINFFISTGSVSPGKDFGYIYLNEELDLKLKPIPLDYNPIAPGDELCVAGLGRDENGKSGSLKIRCSMALSVDTQAGLLFINDKSDLKAGIGSGDSGGPVYRKSKQGIHTVVGVISRGGNGDGTPLYHPDRTISLITPISDEYTKKWISDAKCLKINNEFADQSLCEQ